MTRQKDKYERNLMSKHFPWLFSLKLTILKPKIQNEGIWNLNGDITTRKSVACSDCYTFLGISLKKWHINLRNNSGNCGHANRIADNFNGVGLHLGCWVWVQIAQLGKTVKLGTFMGLAAILTHYLKTIVNATFFYNPRDPK